jgi:hypothetical protein
MASFQWGARFRSSLHGQTYMLAAGGLGAVRPLQLPNPTVLPHFDIPC